MKFGEKLSYLWIIHAAENDAYESGAVLYRKPRSLSMRPEVNRKELQRLG